MKVTVKSLIAYYDCLRKRLNQGKCLLPLPPIYNFLNELASGPVDKYRLEGLVNEEASKKKLPQFYGLRGPAAEEEKIRVEKY